MPRFRLVDRPLVRPTHCVFCRGHKGPLVDTGHELPVVSTSSRDVWRLYVCKKCGLELGRKLGMVDQNKVGELHDRIAELESQVTDLSNRLAREYDKVVVSLDDLRELVHADSD